MKTPTFRERLKNYERLIGTIVTLSHPSVAELLSRSGFDWLFIDGEHGALTVGDIQVLLQAAQPYCPCVVRLPANDESTIKRVLDTGADGIIAPLVNDARTAAAIVRASKYPPEGTRSVGIARAHGYGPGFADYVAGANTAVAVIIQIEHVAGVRNIKEILSVDGIDGVLVGPYDLSASVGKPGRVTDPDVLQMIGTVHTECRNRGIATGIFGTDADAVRLRLSEGFTFAAVGMDTMLLGTAARQAATACR